LKKRKKKDGTAIFSGDYHNFFVIRDGGDDGSGSRRKNGKLKYGGVLILLP
jgi:hypothetical protein